MFVKKTIINKAIVDIRLRPLCAIPPRRSRPIGRIACARKFSEYYLRLPGLSLLLHDVMGDWMIPFAATLQRPLQRRLPILLNGRTTPVIAPSLGVSAPHLIHGSVGLLESSSKTACRSVQPFFLSQRTIECPITLQWAATFPKNWPFPWGDWVSHLTHNTARVINTNGITIGLAIFVWVPNAMMYNASSMGKKTPKIAHSLGISSPRRRRTESWR